MAERQAGLHMAGRQMQSEDHLPVVRQNAELTLGSRRALNQQLERRVIDQVSEIECMNRLRRFQLPPGS